MFWITGSNPEHFLWRKYTYCVVCKRTTILSVSNKHLLPVRKREHCVKVGNMKKQNKSSGCFLSIHIQHLCDNINIEMWIFEVEVPCISLSLKQSQNKNTITKLMIARETISRKHRIMTFNKKSLHKTVVIFSFFTVYPAMFRIMFGNKISIVHISCSIFFTDHKAP